ncbi:acetaldehyde dehydrogenase / alcohol dehydrogenase [Actinobaculum suis]|uniref:alcohol dehydrogenase n=1 Tax=Actinobaculum suis TaxID=1657 RepID=A0A1G7ERC4_9ACTO|nr:bifunctional acetaldehyde-CoA/alcohol dehydrogenase [Actinobaculum suis]MDY5152856.1 bifunctional acetaldehyde-CoA/alcohol dehydrogenase [Actinobaculum suis]SDE66214.1 acetaldehyde dehydrogenase / alcohol dehydrogenase [Actinobaculum suis]
MATHTSIHDNTPGRDAGSEHQEAHAQATGQATGQAAAQAQATKQPAKQPATPAATSTAPAAVPTVDELARRAHQALHEFSPFDQQAINKIVHAMALAGVDNHMHLARLAVEETGRGLFEDKCVKNLFATEYVWNSIKYDRTVGVIHEDTQRGITQIAEPVGVVAGVTPVTNPTSTVMFKSLISIMTRNPIIFAFHPSAQESSAAAARIMYSAARAAGAPEHCIQWIEEPSMEKTHALLNHPLVSLTLATGGAGMVKSAYSTGKPALGVGPGNVPVYIEKSARIERTVNDLLLSKTFDNGMICASEQALFIDSEIAEKVIAEFVRMGSYVLSATERQQLQDYMITEKGTVAAELAGQNALKIARGAGLEVPAGTKLLLVPIEGVGPEHPFSQEKLCPVLGFMEVSGKEEGFRRSQDMLNFGGLGHTAVIHTQNGLVEREFGLAMNACRIIVNSPSAIGGIGDVYNGLIPSLTLGCGSYGRNSVSHNVSAIDLINIKSSAERRNNMQWFKVPPKTYFERYSVQYLQKMPAIERVFIVTDPGMMEHGYVDILIHHLKLRKNNVAWSIFSDVEPNPTSNTVFKGAQQMHDFKPDCIIALGGGSPMDAAKVMWLFYEEPEASYFGMKQKFMDIRKRTYRFPKLGAKARFVAIPTTSGTGAECTPFAVITDSETHMKYPLADYAITPDVAIVDAQFVDSVPRRTAVDSGMDALTHAIESYISVMASDYTRGLSLRAAQMIFENLRPAVLENDVEAKERMHNASALAGMAFANAFLGIVHSLSHKCGAEFDIAHGRANAIFLPHVLRYNATRPYKHAMFPKYESFQADKDLATLARYLGFPASTTEEGVESMIREVTSLAEDLGVDMSLRGNGVTREHLDRVIDGLAYQAFEDQCTTANPVQPLVSDLKRLILDAYEGELGYCEKNLDPSAWQIDLERGDAARGISSADPVLPGTLGAAAEAKAEGAAGAAAGDTPAVEANAAELAALGDAGLSGIAAAGAAVGAPGDHKHVPSGLPVVLSTELNEHTGPQAE